MEIAPLHTDNSKQFVPPRERSFVFFITHLDQKTYFLIGTALFSILVFAIGVIWIFGINPNLKKNSHVQVHSPIPAKGQVTPSVSIALNKSIVPYLQIPVSPQLTRIQNSLDLIIERSSLQDADHDNLYPVGYYSDGIISVGKYSGWTKIIAIESGFTGLATTKEFATQDGKTFVMDGTLDAVSNYKDVVSAQSSQSFYLLNLKKVSLIDHIEDHTPVSFALDNHFVLFEGDIVGTLTKAAGKDVSGKNNVNASIPQDTRHYVKVASTIPSLTLYMTPIEKDAFTANESSETKAASMIRNIYFQNKTSFIGFDQTGLPRNYTMTTVQNFSLYKQQTTAFNAALETYQTAYNKSIADPKNPMPASISTNITSFPSLAFNESDIISVQPHFKSYSVSFPTSCTDDKSTYAVNNVTDADITLIGSEQGISIYKLINPDHPLYHLQYNVKIGPFQNDEFAQINNNAKPPSFSDYVTKNPLLIMKDNFGRFILTGEYDYSVAGGC